MIAQRREGQHRVRPRYMIFQSYNRAFLGALGDLARERCSGLEGARAYSSKGAKECIESKQAHDLG